MKKRTMNRIIRTLCMTLFLFISSELVYAEFSLPIDSLLLSAKNLPQSVRLEQFDHWAKSNMRDLQAKKYIDLLYKEATIQENTHYKANALFLMAQYYYSYNSDSMRFYIQLAEPLLLQEKRIDEFFRLRGWNIYSLTSAGEREDVLREVADMKQLAQKLDYPEGLDMADQALANFYIHTGLNEDGLLLYEEILFNMEKRKAPLTKRVYILRQLLNREVKIDKRLAHLALLKKYIDECENTSEHQLDDVNNLDFLKYLYHRSYVLLAYEMGDSSQMYFHLCRADQSNDRFRWEKDNSTLNQLWFYYYKLTGNYAAAIPLADQLIDLLGQRSRIEDALSVMKSKSEILYLTGDGKSAMDVYRRYIAMKDSITSAKYYENLAKLRTQHDLDALQLQNKKMELEASESNARTLLLIISVCFLLFICTLLAVLAHSRYKYGLQLKKAKEKAEESDQLKSAFLANMNHEIRTPLNAIVGFSGILAEEEDIICRREYYHIIERNNELLQRLIADVLDLSKIESKSMAFSYDYYDLSGLMHEIYHMMLLRMPENVQLELSDVQPCLFYTDRNRLMQILTNLLNNAIKHTTEGSIRLGYEIGEEAVIFYVSDTGSGIPDDKKEMIFSRFVQLDEWTKGVGLGLAICKGLITQMGGSINVESQLGVGSTFYVTLPYRKN